MPAILDDLSVSEDEFEDIWDREHVKLPFSSCNTYRKKNNPAAELNKWYLIEAALQSDFCDSNDLEVCEVSNTTPNSLSLTMC